MPEVAVAGLITDRRATQVSNLRSRSAAEERHRGGSGVPGGPPLNLSVTSTPTIDLNLVANNLQANVQSNSLDAQHLNVLGPGTGQALDWGATLGGTADVKLYRSATAALLRTDTPIATPTLAGGEASGGNLALSSTVHATKGKITFGTSAYDELTNQLLIGTQTPGASVVRVAGTLGDHAFSEFYGMNFAPNWRPTADIAKNYLGIYCDASIEDNTATGNLTGTYIGGRFRGLSRATTRTVTTLLGGEFIARNLNAGTTTTAISGRFGAQVDAGAMTNRFGARVEDTTGAGTVGTQYGLYVNALSKATTNWPLYLSGLMSVSNTGITSLATGMSSLHVSTNAGLDVRARNATVTGLTRAAYVEFNTSQAAVTGYGNVTIGYTSGTGTAVGGWCTGQTTGAGTGALFGGLFTGVVQTAVTVARATGGEFYAQSNFAGGVITDGRAINVRSVTSAGTIGTSYGVYMEDMTSGTTANYALYFSGTSGLARQGIWWNGDTNLYRLAASQLKTDDLLIAESVTVKQVAGTPADSNFTNTAPPDGTLAYSTTLDGLFVREAGVWNTTGILSSTGAYEIGQLGIGVASQSGLSLAIGVGSAFSNSNLGISISNKAGSFFDFGAQFTSFAERTLSTTSGVRGVYVRTITRGAGAKDGAPVVTGVWSSINDHADVKSIAVTSANAGVVTVPASPAHAFIAGERVAIHNVSGVTAYNDLWEVASTTSTTITLVGAGALGVGGSNGGLARITNAPSQAAFVAQLTPMTERTSVLSGLAVNSDDQTGYVVSNGGTVMAGGGFLVGASAAQNEGQPLEFAPVFWHGYGIEGNVRIGFGSGNAMKFFEAMLDTRNATQYGSSTWSPYGAHAIWLGNGHKIAANTAGGIPKVMLQFGSTDNIYLDESASGISVWGTFAPQVVNSGGRSMTLWGTNTNPPEFHIRAQTTGANSSRADEHLWAYAADGTTLHHAVFSMQGNYAVTGTPMLQIGTNSNAGVAFWAFNAEVMRLTSVGDFGIGKYALGGGSAGNKGHFFENNGQYEVTRAAASGVVYRAYVGGDTDARFQIQMGADVFLEWGSGAASTDVWLRRVGANKLRIDSTNATPMIGVGAITPTSALHFLASTAVTGGIQFGSDATPIRFYRSASGATKLEGSLDVIGALTINGVAVATGGSYTDEQAQDAVGAALVNSTSVTLAYVDATPSITATVLPGGVDHNSLSNTATGDVHTQYALLAGRAGGQSLIGGTASGDDLTLTSTSHATKGSIFLGASSEYDGVNFRLGIGVTTPTAKLVVGPAAGTTAVDGIQLGTTTPVRMFRSAARELQIGDPAQDTTSLTLNVSGALASNAALAATNVLYMSAQRAGQLDLGRSAATSIFRIFRPTVASTTSSGSQTLPLGTFNVVSTTGFVSSGKFVVSGQTVTYTGTTATSFTGCTGGTGVIADATAVTQAFPANPTRDITAAGVDGWGGGGAGAIDNTLERIDGGSMKFSNGLQVGTFLRLLSGANTGLLMLSNSVANTLPLGSGDAKAYLRNDKLIHAYNDAGTTKYTALFLKGSTSATLDFASIAANTTAELTVTVTGAAIGDQVLANPDVGGGAMEANLVWSAYVSAANTVTIRIANPSTAAVDPASRTWRVLVYPAGVTAEPS